MSKKIMLDAGHYGYYNQSPAVKDYYESKAMWTLHLMLKAALEARGFIVGTTRADQAKDMEVYLRGKAAEGYDLLISLHSNATNGVNESIDYPVAYVSIDGKGDAIGDKLAKEVARIMGTKQVGRIATKKNDKGEDYYGITNGANAAGSVGIILEHSFHTQTAATKWLLSDGNLRKLAEAEAAVIAEHYGVSKTVATPVKAETTNTVKFDLFGEKTVNIPGSVISGVTHVQARQLLEAMGFVVGWNDKEKCVTVRLSQSEGVSTEDRELLQKIVWAEARGEDLKGQILVVNVIQNRVKDKGFPNSVRDVIYQENQFQPTRDGSFDKAVPTKSNIEAVERALCVDYSQGALYFRTINGATPDCWHEKNLTRLFDHGGHRFYK